MSNFSKEDLMASLEMFSSPTTDRQRRPESIVAEKEVENQMQQLQRSAVSLGSHKASSVPGPPTKGPTRSATPVRSGKPAKLERVNSVTGRPEEIYKTIKRAKPKGHVLQVGHYQLGEKLGKGAFGVVYKGLDMKTGQFVAVKRIARDAVDENHMMKEINFLKTFNHKNIVSYVNMLQTEKHVNLVLEFVDSGSLAQVLAGYGFFPEPLAAIYTAQVLEGLHYLHTQQVIHRDIKGGNLLITRDGAIKLADFGIATVASSNPRHSLVEGSPFWMAPEVIEMSCNPTTASDIWSLGCTLLELLTGMPPYFEMAAVAAVFRMVNDPHPPLPDDLSPELTNFLKQCFAREPSKRPTALALRSHPWIIKYAPVNTNNKPMNVEQVRLSIKRYTMNKESGSKLFDDFDKLDLTADSFEDAVAPKVQPPKTVVHAAPERSVPAPIVRKNSQNNSVGKPGPADIAPAAPLQFEIFSAETRRSFFTFTIYHIKVTKNGSQTWNLERTYSDFKDLYGSLTTEVNVANLPKCPPDKFWGVMDSDFIRKRWQELQNFLVDLAKIPEVRDSASFTRFITNKQ